jgi:hypothetical protein
VSAAGAGAPGPVPGTDDLVGRLAAAAEELADMALDRLQRALDAGDGAPHLAVEERRLTRARRSVERAIGILGAGDAP